MKRSEIFRVQCFAKGKSVELDSFDAQAYVQAREVLATPGKYAKTIEASARAVIGAFDQALKHGLQPRTFASLDMPFWNDNSVVDEDVDAAALTLAERRLLASPNILLQDCEPAFQKAYRELHKND